MYNYLVYIVGVLEFVVAVFFGLQAYHKKSVLSVIYMFVWIFGGLTCFVGEYQPWWIYTMVFIDGTFMLMFITDAHLFVHGYSKPIEPKDETQAKDFPDDEFTLTREEITKLVEDNYFANYIEPPYEDSKDIIIKDVVKRVISSYPINQDQFTYRELFVGALRNL